MTRVILIIIDGCRADALQQAPTPNIDQLVSNGACTFEAATVIPPITLPAHFSIFTSQEPYSHSVLTNTGRPTPSPSATTLTEQVKASGKTTAAVYSWEHLRNLAPPGALDHVFFQDTANDKNGDLQIAAAAANCLRDFRPDFLFTYLEGVDRAGHKSGWMSRAYIEALQQADAAVGVVLEALATTNLDEETAIVLHSDHGGSAHHHIDPIPQNLTIPWIASGPGIRKGYAIHAPVSVLATAPTIAGLMGIPRHFSWSGRPVDEIFAPAPANRKRAALLPPLAMRRYLERVI